MITKNKSVIVLFHVLAWSVLFSLPYLVSSGEDHILIRVFAHSWVPLIFYAALFYINYLLFVERLLFKRKALWFVVLNLLVISVFVFVRGDINDVFFKDVFRPRDNEDGPPRQLFLYLQSVSYTLPVVCAIAFKTLERWKRTEAERKEAANIKLQSELQHLHYQLQPHFFFNSLNNIYSLVDISPEQAKSTIHSLGKLMRYLLYETKSETVSLSKEIEFMLKYVDLMRLRLTEKTHVEVDFPSEAQTIKVVPLLFISLIENAFKHGVSAQEEAIIAMKMTVEDNVVSFWIKNRNFPKTETDRSGSGIGLQNLEKRLQLLYPDRHLFENKVENGMYSVHLIIET